MLVPVKEIIATRSIPEPNSGCWLWLGWVDQFGYGILQRNKKYVRAHRVSWEEHKGPIPEGLQALHKCDVTCCINPDHLFLGTHQDNMADMVKKGRQPKNKGEKNPRAKLTQEQVDAIRASSASKVSLARQYGVSDVMISYIVNGKNWRTS